MDSSSEDNQQCSQFLQQNPLRSIDLYDTYGIIVQSMFQNSTEQKEIKQNDTNSFQNLTQNSSLDNQNIQNLAKSFSNSKIEENSRLQQEQGVSLQIKNSKDQIKNSKDQEQQQNQEQHISQQYQITAIQFSDSKQLPNNNNVLSQLLQQNSQFNYVEQYNQQQFQKLILENFTEQQREQYIKQKERLQKQEQFRKDYQNTQFIVGLDDIKLINLALIEKRFPSIFKQLKAIFNEVSETDQRVFYKLVQKMVEINQQYFPAQKKADQLKKQIQKQDYMYSLDLSNKHAYKDLILSMNLLRLTKLTFDKCKFSDSEFIQLVQRLKFSVHLMFLSFNQNQISIVGFSKFISYTTNFQNLIEVQFDSNKIQDEGVILFVKVAQKYKNLEMFSFQNNLISDKGFNYFLKYRKNFGKLYCANFNLNRINTIQQQNFVSIETQELNKSLQKIHIKLLKNDLADSTIMRIFQFQLNQKINKQYQFFITYNKISIRNAQTFDGFMQIYYNFYNLIEINMQKYKITNQTISILIQNIWQFKKLQIMKINCSNFDINNHVQFLILFTQQRQKRQKKRLVLNINETQFTKKSIKQLSRLLRFYKNDPQISLILQYKDFFNQINKQREIYINLKLKIMKLVTSIQFSSSFQHAVIQQQMKDILDCLKLIRLSEDYLVEKYSFVKLQKVINKIFQMELRDIQLGQRYKPTILIVRDYLIKYCQWEKYIEQEQLSSKKTQQRNWEIKKSPKPLHQPKLNQIVNKIFSQCDRIRRQHPFVKKVQFKPYNLDLFRQIKQSDPSNILNMMQEIQQKQSGQQKQLCGYIKNFQNTTLQQELNLELKTKK